MEHLPAYLLRAYYLYKFNAILAERKAIELIPEHAMRYAQLSEQLDKVDQILDLPDSDLPVPSPEVWDEGADSL